MLGRIDAITADIAALDCPPSLGMTTTGCCSVVDAADVAVGVGAGLILVVCTVSVSRN